MNVEDLWEAKVPIYSNDDLICFHHYENVVASRPRLATGAKTTRVLMREETNAV